MIQHGGQLWPVAHAGQAHPQPPAPPPGPHVIDIQKLKASAITLTGVAYKGTHVKTLNLKAGQWTFFSPSGTKNYFIVSR